MIKKKSKRYKNLILIDIIFSILFFLLAIYCFIKKETGWAILSLFLGLLWITRIYFELKEMKR